MNRLPQLAAVMAEVTAGAAKAKAATLPVSPFGPPRYEIAISDLPNMQMPQVFPEISEKGIPLAKDTYDNPINL
jgi:hypothetical protein